MCVVEELENQKRITISISSFRELNILTYVYMSVSSVCVYEKNGLDKYIIQTLK